MMEYKLFKELMTQRILEYLPPLYRSYRPDVRQVNKVNETKDAFCLMPPKTGPTIAIPTLYLDDLYRDFAEDEDLDRVLRAAASVFMQWTGYEVPSMADFSVADFTDSVIACLINRPMNRELLSAVPHEDLLDMAVIYRLIFRADDNGFNTTIITSSMLEGTELTEEKLREMAQKNTRRIFPAKILTGSEEGVLILTNEYGCYGAATMMYRDTMKKVAEKLGGDFYILPSSIHEFFAVSVDTAEPMELVRMLAAGNEHITAPQERLSSSIYRYTAEDGELCKVVSYSMEDRSERDRAEGTE